MGTARLRAAWSGSGLSQDDFAAALGTSPARLGVYLTGRAEPPALFLARAERIGRGLARARDGGLLSAPAAVSEVRGATDRVGAWLSLLQACDDLRTALTGTTAEVVGAWQAAPVSTGDDELDRLLRTLVAREFDAARLTPPPWSTRERQRGLTPA